MRVIDLHCDTLACAEQDGRDLFRNEGQLDLERGIRLGSWVQTFACFLPSSLRGEEAYQTFLRQRGRLLEALERYPDTLELYHSGIEPVSGKCTALLSVEGGTALAGKAERIEEFKKLGVSFFTLVWNGDNELAHGVGGENAGLTSFGRECLAELEKWNILPDISHLNDLGMADVFSLTEGPVLATHSNLRSVWDHPRNLTEEQFRELVRRKGLCGINYYPAFVNGGSDYEPEALRRHLERMLELGGEDILALGSDYDGADMPAFLCSVEKLAVLREYVVEWYGEGLAEKLFFENARRFLEKNLRV